MTEHKAFPLAHFKAAPADTAEPGTFEAIVSVFGNVDHVGDRVMPGAFEKTLAEWKASGDPVPVIWSHEWKDPTSHIGQVLDAEERPAGLWVKAKIDLDQPKAAHIYRLLLERRVKEMSFAYDVRDQAPADDDPAVNELKELGLIEVGPTLKGANPATQLLAVKHQLLSGDEAASLFDEKADELEQERAPEPEPADDETQQADAPAADTTSDTPEQGAKAGRALSKRTEQKLRNAVQMLQDVLSAVEKDDAADEGKAADPPDGDEEPVGAKSDLPVTDEVPRTPEAEDNAGVKSVLSAEDAWSALLGLGSTPTSVR